MGKRLTGAIAALAAALAALLLPDAAMAAPAWDTRTLGFWAVVAIVVVSVGVWRNARGDGLLGVLLWSGGLLVLILLVRFPPPPLLRMLG